MSLIPSQNNFADIRESVDKLLAASTDDTAERLAGLVGMIAYRCDLLEREVERLGNQNGAALTRSAQGT